MTREEFNILNNLYEASLGRARSTADLGLKRSLRDKAARKSLCEKGYIEAHSGELTEKGLAALEPYRVDSAVILAAGSATRFIPLSLEQPKGLYEVRGEKLIERQIQQLKEAGIADITVVLGYKKDMFAYLGEKYSVRLIFNPAYNVKNNIESILVAKDYLKTAISVSVTAILRRTRFISLNSGRFMPASVPEKPKMRCMRILMLTAGLSVWQK